MSVTYMPKVPPKLNVTDAAVMTDDDMQLILEDQRKQLDALKGYADRPMGSMPGRWVSACRNAERVLGQNIAVLNNEIAARSAARRAGFRRVETRPPEQVEFSGRLRQLRTLLGKEGAQRARENAFVQIAWRQLPKETFLAWMEEANAACLEAASGVDQESGSVSGDASNGPGESAGRVV